MVGLTGRGPSLSAFLKLRLEDGLYQGELGLLDQVQGDIQELSDTLVPESSRGVVDRADLERLFPRGEPRVVLLVDDLRSMAPAESTADGEIVAQWFDDWAVYIADRDAYSVHASRFLYDASSDPDQHGFVATVLQLRSWQNLARPFSSSTV